MKNLITILIALLITGVIAACNPFAFEPTEDHIEDTTTIITDTVTNTSMHVISNLIEMNHDENYFPVQSIYYTPDGYVNFYFAFIQTNRTIVLYLWNGARTQETVVPDMLGNFIVENGRLRVPDPTSNYLGEWMHVKVLWEEWELSYSNY